MIPVLIKVVKKKALVIRWDDNSESTINLTELRRYCPCATCMAIRDEQSQSFIPLYFSDQLTVLNVVKIGNYALSIKWKDGHNTGIYEFPYLRKLASK